MNFYVICIDENGMPGQLLGPFDYQTAELALLDQLKQLPEMVGEKELAEAEADGEFCFSCGGGYYIIQSESGE